MRSSIQHHSLSLALYGALALLCLSVEAQAAGLGHGVDAFAETDVFIEVNDTDQDWGLQIFFDADGWEWVSVLSPGFRRVFHVSNHGSLREIGSTEVFTESEEPEADELPFEDFLALFPAGTYRFVGRTVEGRFLFGRATLTHDLPDGPVIVSPAEESAVDPNNAYIMWDPVTTPAGIEIVSYQVIVEIADETTGFLREYAVDLAPDVTSVMVPAAFFDLDAIADLEEPEIKVEVLAIEASGNKTISEREFELIE